MCVSLEASSIGVVCSGLCWSAWLCGVEAGDHGVSLAANKVEMNRLTTGFCLQNDVAGGGA